MNWDSCTVIGVMSGSSLDGLDLALCKLGMDAGKWRWKVIEARTLAYEDDLRSRLVRVMDGSALDLARMHVELGRRIGGACKQIAGERHVDLIGSHGHTIFHKPDDGLTTQVGCGAQIAAISGIATVCDFRTMDVALGGQGAPLVPLGEKLLFPETTCFVNLGGIANISVHRADRVIGYDIGPCNMALNYLAGDAGKSFDRDGQIAASGSIVPDLLEQLNTLSFYQQAPPRSLGREWFDQQMLPIIRSDRISLADRMRTVVEHIASQLANELDRHQVESAMITGGGAHNVFLIERFRALSKVSIHVPGKLVIDFKEALIFGLLAVLRMREEVNALASVTGAARGSVGGAVYWGN